MKFILFSVVCTIYGLLLVLTIMFADTSNHRRSQFANDHCTDCVTHQMSVSVGVFDESWH